MLFRKFMWITLSVTIMGVILSNILQASHPAGRGFGVENRAHEWNLRDSRYSCKADKRYCNLVITLASRV